MGAASMKLTCPACGSQFDYREAFKDATLIQVIRMQPEFGPHSALVFEYAELFDTTRGTIKAAKLLRVLTEVRDLWKAGRFSINRQTYMISQGGIAQALKIVCNKNLTSLDNHNYLKKVMVTVAEEEEKKRSVDKERVLKEKERMLRGGMRPPDKHIDDDEDFVDPAVVSGHLKTIYNKLGSEKK